jgi:chromosome segregation ATPase
MSTKLEALTQRLNADPALSDALSEYFREHAAERDALRAEVERLSSALAEQESRANKFHEQAEAHAAETTELRRAICEAMGYSTKVVYPSDSEIATRVLALHERCEHQDAAFIKGAPHDEADGCPTFYDGCNCTVETLVHNIDRAKRAEGAVRQLRAACEIMIKDQADIFAAWHANVADLVSQRDRLLRASQSNHRAWRREREEAARMRRWAECSEDEVLKADVRVAHARGDLRDQRDALDRLRAFVSSLRSDGLDIDDPDTAPVWTGKIHRDGRLVFDLATVRTEQRGTP